MFFDRSPGWSQPSPSTLPVSSCPPNIPGLPSPIGQGREGFFHGSPVIAQIKRLFVRCLGSSFWSHEGSTIPREHPYSASNSRSGSVNSEQFSYAWPASLKCSWL